METNNTGIDIVNNVYDSKLHPIPACQQIKDAWQKQQCKYTNGLQSETCMKLFQDYYECHYEYLGSPAAQHSSKKQIFKS